MSYARTAYAGLPFGADLPEADCGEDFIVVEAYGAEPYCDDACPEGWFICPQPSESGSLVCSEPYLEGLQAPYSCTTSGEDITDEEGPTDATTTPEVATETVPASSDSASQITAAPPETALPPPVAEESTPTPTWAYIAAAGTLLLIGAAVLR